MKNISITLFFSIITTVLFSQNSWIRVNQIGYLENDIKVAVFISKSDVTQKSFELVDYSTNEIVYKGTKVRNTGKTWGFDSSARLRSEEHTSELQSRPHLVCRLLLEKKKNNPTTHLLTSHSQHFNN